MFSTYHLMAKGDLDVHAPFNLPKIEHVLGNDENEMAAKEIAIFAKDQCAWRKLVNLLRSQRIMMMIMSEPITF